MSSKFDAYEIIAVIAPGTLLLFGLALLFPDLKILFFEGGFSIGDLGLFLILSFIAGHLIQALGNLIEAAIWWPFGGLPTAWLIEKPNKLIEEGQITRLRQALKADFGCELRELTSIQLYPIVREIYLAIKADTDTTRIDSFNRTYGLMRGVTATLALLVLLTTVITWPNWIYSALLAIAALIAGYRMFRFGKRYVCELIVAYLRLQKLTTR